MNGFNLIVIVISSLLPDLIDLALFSKETFHTYHRVITHSIAIIGVLYLAMAISPMFSLVSFGFTLHLFEDILGGGPLYLLPFYGKFILLDDTRINKLGRAIKPYFEVFIEETEYLPVEFVWFYFLIITGSAILGLGLMLYLL